MPLCRLFLNFFSFSRFFFAVFCVKSVFQPLDGDAIEHLRFGGFFHAPVAEAMEAEQKQARFVARGVMRGDFVIPFDVLFREAPFGVMRESRKIGHAVVSARKINDCLVAILFERERNRLVRLRIVGRRPAEFIGVVCPALIRKVLQIAQARALHLRQHQRFVDRLRDRLQYGFRICDQTVTVRIDVKHPESEIAVGQVIGRAAVVLRFARCDDLPLDQRFQIRVGLVVRVAGSFGDFGRPVLAVRKRVEDRIIRIGHTDRARQKRREERDKGRIKMQQSAQIFLQWKIGVGFFACRGQAAGDRPQPRSISGRVRRQRFFEMPDRARRYGSIFAAQNTAAQRRRHMDHDQFALMQRVQSQTEFFGRAFFILDEKNGHSGIFRGAELFKHSVPVRRRRFLRQKQMQKFRKRVRRPALSAGEIPRGRSMTLHVICDQLRFARTGRSGQLAQLARFAMRHAIQRTGNQRIQLILFLSGIKIYHGNHPILL